MSKVSIRHREMQYMLPRFYDDAPEADAIMHANAEEIESVRQQARDLLAQLTVETSTWGLADWERVLELPPRPNSPTELRRARILAKLRGTAPATIANMLEIINAHVPNQDAQLVELPEPGIVDVEIPLQQGIKLGDLAADVNTYKPAHLQFIIVILTKIAVLNLVVKTYDFNVPYPITNTFQTDNVPGKLANIPLSLAEDVYTFPVYMPICNSFVTSTVNSSSTELSFELTNEYRNVEVLYKRASNNIIAGEGEL